MPTSADIAFAIGVLIFIAVGFLYFDRRGKIRIAAGLPNARRNAYRFVVTAEWGITVIALLLWARAKRPWRALGLVPALDWHVAPGILIPALIIAMLLRRSRRIRRLGAARLAKLRGRLDRVEFFLPHTPAEHREFLLMSLTAGFCEELVYRGFLTWFFASYIGLPAAIGIVTVSFGLDHAYLGRHGALDAALVGLVMSLIVSLTGWLVPAMIVHALIDISGGELGFAVLSPTHHENRERSLA